MTMFARFWRHTALENTDCLGVIWKNRVLPPGGYALCVRRRLIGFTARGFYIPVAAGSTAAAQGTRDPWVGSRSRPGQTTPVWSICPPLPENQGFSLALGATASAAPDATVGGVGRHLWCTNRVWCSGLGRLGRAPCEGLRGVGGRREAPNPFRVSAPTWCAPPQAPLDGWYCGGGRSLVPGTRHHDGDVNPRAPS